MCSPHASRKDVIVSCLIQAASGGESGKSSQVVPLMLILSLVLHDLQDLLWFRCSEGLVHALMVGAVSMLRCNMVLDGF